MNVPSAPSRTSDARSTLPATHTYARVTSHERRDLDISYSDDTSSVHLTLSSEMLRETVLYTGDGSLARRPAESIAQSGDTLTATSEMAEPATAETDDSDEAQTALLRESLDRYQLLTARRVMYLLQAIAEERRRIMGEDTGTSDTVVGITVTGNSTVTTTGTATTEPAGDAAPLTGAFSAENTAARIVNFALAFYNGGDRAAYAEKIKTAVMKGFELAKSALGGWAPQDSYDTIALAIDAVDEWATGGMELTA